MDSSSIRTNPSEFNPLPPGSIRLLRLLPYHTAGPSSLIRCQLIPYALVPTTTSSSDINASHIYQALSYVWGSTANPRQIEIDGDTITITANLHSALLGLRNRSFERVLWIDALCINQDDLKERAEQIQMMAEIYGKACQVVVWLGEEERAGDDEIGALEMVRMAAEEDRQMTDKVVESPKKPIDGIVLELLRRDWFRRIWVLQEVAAARHVIIKYGSSEIDGYTFASGLDCFLYKRQPQLEALIPSVAYLIRGAIFRSKNTARNEHHGRFSLGIGSLGELVSMYHARESSLRPDKIFALLGMTSDTSIPPSLAPDYRTSWGLLFKSLIKYVFDGASPPIKTWDHLEMAVLEVKAVMLGQVMSVDASPDRQVLNIKVIGDSDQYAYKDGYSYSYRHTYDDDDDDLRSGYLSQSDKEDDDHGHEWNAHNYYETDTDSIGRGYDDTDVEGTAYLAGHASDVDSDPTQDDEDDEDYSPPEEDPSDRDDYTDEYASGDDWAFEKRSSAGETRRWVVPVSASAVRQGDVICLPHGTSRATILRPQADYFSIVITSLSLPDEKWMRLPPPDEEVVRHLLCVWDWGEIFSSSGKQDLEGLLMAADLAFPNDLGEEEEEQKGGGSGGQPHASKTHRLQSVALALADLGRHGEAAERQRQVLEAGRSTGNDLLLDENAQGDFALMSDIAHSCRKGRQWKQAEDAFRRLISAQQTTLGVDHPDVLESMRGLATVYRSSRRWWAAEKQEAMIELLDNTYTDSALEDKFIDYSEKFDSEVTRLALGRYGSIPVTEHMVRAAAANKKHGSGIIEFLLAERGGEVNISTDVMRTAVANKRSGASIVRVILRDTHKCELDMTDPIRKVVSDNREVILRLILGQSWEEEQGADGFELDKDLVEAMESWSETQTGRAVFWVLIDEKSRIRLSERVIENIAQYFSESTILQLFEKRREEVASIWDALLTSRTGSHSLTRGLLMLSDFNGKARMQAANRS